MTHRERICILPGEYHVVSVDCPVPHLNQSILPRHPERLHHVTVQYAWGVRSRLVVLAVASYGCARVFTAADDDLVSKGVSEALHQTEVGVVTGLHQEGGRGDRRGPYSIVVIAV